MSLVKPPNVGPRGIPRTFPPVSQALVDYLTALYPLKPPNPKQTDREIWIEVGRQELLEALRNRVRIQPTSAGALTEISVSEV